jgi:hypothetical protein
VIDNPRPQGAEGRHPFLLGILDASEQGQAELTAGGLIVWRDDVPDVTSSISRPQHGD